MKTLLIITAVSVVFLAIDCNLFTKVPYTFKKQYSLFWRCIIPGSGIFMYVLYKIKG